MNTEIMSNKQIISQKRSDKPLILIPSGIQKNADYCWHAVSQNYIRAISQSCNAYPLLLPAYYDYDAFLQLMDIADGLLLPGSISNIHPSNYGIEATKDHAPFDSERDSVTLPLINIAIAHNLPIFAICRGFQELNVALGGTIDTEVQDIPGRMDHREPASYNNQDERFAIKHEIEIQPGGLLAKISQSGKVMVNSLHRQAIARLGDNLQVEAVAPDGTIEAISVTEGVDFAIGIQWHPEYFFASDPLSKKLFAAFCQAIQNHKNKKLPRDCV